MTQMTLAQKLATLQPLVDLQLFETSPDYRNKVLNLLAEQEQSLVKINEEFGHPQPENFEAGKRYVLGYN